MSQILIDIERCWSENLGVWNSIDEMVNYGEPLKGLKGIGEDLIQNKGIRPEFVWVNPRV